MAIFQSLGLKVTNWVFDPSKKKDQFKTDCEMGTHALRKNSETGAAGLCFTWELSLKSRGVEFLNYSTQECFIIPDKIITDKELKNIIADSFRNASKDLIGRNMKAGVDAGFPDFNQIPLNLSEIKSVLHT